MKEGLHEQHKYKTFKIVFAVKNSIPYSSVLWGMTVMKHCTGETMELVKEEIKVEYV